MQPYVQRDYDIANMCRPILLVVHSIPLLYKKNYRYYFNLIFFTYHAVECNFVRDARNTGSRTTEEEHKMRSSKLALDDTMV